jgi:CO/xanthine dehydrogenase Mo-binding subunit
MDTESSFRKCVATEAGLRYEDTFIQVQRSDAGAYQFWVPGGAMGIGNSTPQLILAARALKKKILNCATRPRPAGMMPMMGTPPPMFPGKKIEDLDVRDSYVFEKANPNNRKSVKEVANAFWGEDPAIVHPVAPAITGLTLNGKPHPAMYIMSRQAHFIEVEVDTETGEILVTNVVCVNDVGHLFSRRGAEAQQYGGAIMGLGRSATEEKVYCPRTGVGLNFDNIGYHIGTMNDYPEVKCIINESHQGYSSYGACGVGEDSAASMSGITAGAFFNATGKWALDYPLTPNRVLKALGRI